MFLDFLSLSSGLKLGNPSGFLFSNCVMSNHNDDDHRKEELAKFGYWVILENFKNLTIFMAKFRKNSSC